MDIIVLVRLAITLTFLILAAGGPYAIILLRRFIRSYTAAHVELELRTTTLERRVTLLERRMEPPGTKEGEP